MAKAMLLYHFFPGLKAGVNFVWSKPNYVVRRIM